MRVLLIVLGVVNLVVGLVAFAEPQFFYDSIPGARMMGPFNAHFIRDVGLAFLLSGGAMAYGALHWLQGVAVVGAGWPFLHALFHLQIQIGRGLPMDHVMWFDLFAVMLPAFAGLWLAWRLPDAA